MLLLLLMVGVTGKDLADVHYHISTTMDSG